MSRFHKLTVTGITKTIRDAVAVTLTPEDGADFSFAAGQHLTFRRDFDGVELRRNYSICTAPSEGVLKIGIKRVEGGVFSSWANADLKVGDVLEAMPPSGRFTVKTDPDAAKNYLGFAGGSGITPVLSILKTVLEEEPKSQFTLVYANRAVNTIMFREELEDLKNLYMGRLTVIHVLETDAQEIDLFTGRVDEEKCALLFKHWIDIASVDMALMCGPQPMMEGITRALKDHGLRDDQIHFELFKSDQPGRAPRPAQVVNGHAVLTKAQVTLDGATQSFEVPEGMSILEAAVENNLDAPFACKAGVCSTCRAKLIEGEVDMVANHALEDYEVEAGYVLTCQCYPLSEKVVVDYDL